MTITDDELEDLKLRIYLNRTSVRLSPVGQYYIRIHVEVALFPQNSFYVDLLSHVFTPCENFVSIPTGIGGIFYDRDMIPDYSKDVFYNGAPTWDKRGQQFFAFNEYIKYLTYKDTYGYNLA